MGFWLLLFLAAITIAVAVGSGILIGVDYGFKAGFKAGMVDSTRRRKTSVGNEPEEQCRT